MLGADVVMPELSSLLAGHRNDALGVIAVPLKHRQDGSSTDALREHVSTISDLTGAGTGR